MLMKRAMELVVKRQVSTMIMGISLIFPLSVAVNAGEAVVFPSPTAFSVSMELGDMREAAAWLDAGLPPDFMGSRIGSGLMIGAWEGNIDLMRLFISRRGGHQCLEQ